MVETVVAWALAAAMAFGAIFGDARTEPQDQEPNEVIIIQDVPHP